MKERTGSAIAVVSILISCLLVCVGCHPPRRYISVDSGSAVMQPTFCLYRDPDFQQRLNIRNLTVWKVPRSAEEKNRWKIDWPFDGRQTVWHVEYKASDTFMKRLLTSFVPCLTYGEVPPGYQEKVKARPLEPEEFYGVWIRGNDGMVSEDLYFIIRLDGMGIPERLEYHQEIFLITYPKYSSHPRDDLKLY